MRLITKSGLITVAGIILLGTSLALSSAGIVSGASQVRYAGGAEPAKKTCDTKKYCLTESNQGSGGGISASSSTIGISASGGSCSICTGVYSTAGGMGVYGAASGSSASSPGYGVFGTAPNFGVYGAASNNSGDGVYGVGGGGTESNQSGIGVYGEDDAASGYGVEGVQNALNGAGVYGSSTSGVGVSGFSTSSTGGAFVNTSSDNATFALVASNSSGGGLFGGYGTNDAQIEFDTHADGLFDGFVEALGGYKTVVPTDDGKKLSASLPMAPQPTMEDTGTDRLVNGEAAVRFDSAFASTIDARRGYQVFLTPNGETRGWLYVAAKYERGFIVREGLHGHSSVAFDYRVVAHPLGSSDQRLPAYIPPRRPNLPHLQRTVPSTRRPALPRLPSGG
jgi:hypothetical protein